MKNQEAPKAAFDKQLQDIFRKRGEQTNYDVFPEYDHELVPIINEFWRARTDILNWDEEEKDPVKKQAVETKMHILSELLVMDPISDFISNREAILQLTKGWYNLLTFFVTTDFEMGPAMYQYIKTMMATFIFVVRLEL